MAAALPKGSQAEEVLRNYFLSIGYFVIRGAKFKYAGFDITDIDLWLYSKNTSISRERLNVDIKNKKTPQALERIFWAKGLQNVLKLDGCIVATTDTRQDVRSFGSLHNVRVLDGNFLSRVIKSSRSQLDRISEEELVVALDEGSIGKLAGDWKGRYEKSKSKLLDSLSFDGCNFWLSEINYFLEQYIQTKSQNTPALRLVYLNVSYFLIGLDFVLREQLTLDQEQRASILNGGFRYGALGKEYADKVTNLASELVVSVTHKTELKSLILEVMSEQADSIRAEILSDYLSKLSVLTNLFELARELEDSAFKSEVPALSSLSASAQSMVMVILDFFEIDRKKVE